MLIMVMMILSKGLGFLREVCLAYQFGTSYIVDAYAICLSLADVLFAVYSYGFSESYIPVCTRVPEGNARREFLNNVLSILLLFSLLVSIGCFLCAPMLAAVLAPGFDAQAQILLITFIQIIAFIFPARTLFSLLSGQSQIYERFFAPNFCNFILVNIIIILSILLSSAERPLILIGGYVFASFASAAGMLGYSYRIGIVKYSPRFDLKDPFFRSLCKLAIPLGASLLVSQLNGVIDKMFASFLGEGVPSALNYANKIQLLFLTLTTSVFLTACYPRMTRCFAEGNREGAMSYLRRAVLVAIYISIPAMVGLIVFARPVVVLLFQRGAFSEESVVLTRDCLVFYSLGIPFYAIREIASRALSSNMKQRLILKNTACSVAFNIIMDVLLYRPLGHIGLALATSLAGFLSSCLMLRDMKKLGLSLFERSQLADFGKVVLSTIACIALSIFCYQALTGFLGGNMALLLAAAAAVILYGVLSILLRIEIFMWLYQRLPAKMQIINM